MHTGCLNMGLFYQQYVTHLKRHYRNMDTDNTEISNFLLKVAILSHPKFKQPECPHAPESLE